MCSIGRCGRGCEFCVLGIAVAGLFWYNNMINLFANTKMKKRKNYLFQEKRLTFMAPPERMRGSAETAKKTRESAIKMLGQMAKIQNLPGWDQPEKFLNANPFQHKLYEQVNKMHADDANFKVLEVEDKPDQQSMKVSYELGSGSDQYFEYEFTDEAYYALVWDTVAPTLKVALQGKIDDGLMDAYIMKAVETGQKEFMEMVAVIATGGQIAAEMVEKVVKEFEAWKGAGRNAREAMRGMMKAKLSAREKLEE